MPTRRPSIISAHDPSRGLLLCDLDDTLIDRAEAFSDWVRMFAARNKLGREAMDILGRLDYDRDSGHRARLEYFTIARDVFGLTCCPEELTREYLDDMARLARPVRGVEAAMRWAVIRGWPIVVVTNGGYRQQVKLRVAGLDRLVTAIVISASAGLAKPDPGIFRYAAERAGWDGAAPWVVGDHPVNDIQAGCRAGMRTAWVSRGRPWTLPGTEPTVISAATPGAIRRAAR
jgi:FMN phosphatase YigB (HAD superfamily)